MSTKKKVKEEEVIEELTIESLAEEINKLREELKIIKTEFTFTSHKALKIAQDTNVEAKRVSMVLGRNYLIKAKEDAKTIMHHYRINFLKSIVMSEVAGAYAQRRGNSHKDNYKIMLLIIQAYDNDDAWWMARESFSLIQWIKALLKEE